MKTITATELKTRCLALLDEVARSGSPVLITKRGKAVAQLVAPAPARSRQDDLRGSVEILGDIVSPAIPAAEWEVLAMAEERRRQPSRMRRAR